MTRPGKPELALVLMLGLAALLVRAPGLGLADWHYDEAFHVYAARSLLEDGEPSLPSGRVYLRSIWLSRVGSWMFDAFGVSESVARVPGIVMGSLAVLLLWGLSRRYTGRAAALVAAGLYAFSPFCIALSRFFRYYAEIQLFYLVAFLLAVRYLERSVPLRDALREFVRCSTRAKVFRVVGLAVIALVAWLGYRDNSLFLLILPSIGVVVGVRWLGDVLREGWRSALGKTDAALLGLAGGGLALISLAAPRFVVKMVRQTEAIQAWASGNAGDPWYYAQVLLGDYPLFPVFFAVGAVLLWRRARWGGALVVSGCLVPLTVMSTVLIWRVDRYMGFVLPLFFVVVGYGMAESVRGLERWTVRRTSGRVAGVLVALVAVAYLAAVPWPRKIPEVLRSTIGLYEGLVRSELRSASATLLEALGEDDVIVSSSALGVSYYLGRPVTHVITDSHGKPKSTRPHYSGAERISGAGDLARVVAQRPRGWIVLESQHWAGTTLSEGLKRAIEASSERVREGIPPSVVVFRWDR